MLKQACTAIFKKDVCYLLGHRWNSLKNDPNRIWRPPVDGSHDQSTQVLSFWFSDWRDWGSGLARMYDHPQLEVSNESLNNDTYAIDTYDI